MFTKTQTQAATSIAQERTAEIHCLICSHRVSAQVMVDRRGAARVKSGEKCGRCGSSLGAGYVLGLEPAA